MPQEDRTRRERLAYELELATENLWVLVDRDAQAAGESGAPPLAELEDLVSALRALDTIGASLAPDLYRPAERRRGPLDVAAPDPMGWACPQCGAAMLATVGADVGCAGCGAEFHGVMTDCDHRFSADLDGWACDHCGRRASTLNLEPLSTWWARVSPDLVDGKDE